MNEMINSDWENQKFDVILEQTYVRNVCGLQRTGGNDWTMVLRRQRQE